MALNKVLDVAIGCFFFDSILKCPDSDSSEKAEESVPEHAALERRSKKKADECVPEHAAHERRTKRLQRQKGKVAVFEDSPPNEIKIKYGDIVMTSSQVPGPATSKKSVIAQLKGTCKELEDSIRSSTATKIKLEKLMKDLMEEEKKKAEQGGEDNGGTDVEDSANGNDAGTDEDKEAEGEEYATTDLDSQEDI
ncbi:hypothetical protein KIW84_046393 [Lathyrus oleraceus]|uniref:Uncharacterized protein n=1 Tax=Pisum sativum TaxID=3888 RepID=A0A9D4XL93_PEA|nr:hypothetical protein KIW84_046393 [Pisum sativum]